MDCVHLAVASRDGEWSVVGTDVRHDLKVPVREHARGQAPSGKAFELIALSPFAKRLVGATGNTLSIIDVAAAAAGKGAKHVEIESMPCGHHGVTSLAYSADGLRVLSAGEDGRLRLWRVEDANKAGQV